MPLKQANMIISLFSQVLVQATAGLGDTLQACVKVRHSFISTSRARNLGRGRAPVSEADSSPVYTREVWGYSWFTLPLLKVAPVPLYVFIYVFYKRFKFFFKNKRDRLLSPLHQRNSGIAKPTPDSQNILGRLIWPAGFTSGAPLHL